jgi:hypothetical protein
MESRPTIPAEETHESIRRNLVRRATELAMIHGRAAHEPAKEDVQQAKREVKPLKMSQKSFEIRASA